MRNGQLTHTLHFIHVVVQSSDTRDLRNLTVFIDIIVEAFSDVELLLHTLGVSIKRYLVK